MTEPLEIENESQWKHWQDAWSLRDDTIYLNHGSFGPPPDVVRAARRQWIDRLDRQPMDFFVRTLENELDAARRRLADFVGTRTENLVLVDNATYGMNVVAESFSLHAGDEVLLTDHEYGAVRRIWERACGNCGAQLKFARLPQQIKTADDVVDAILGGMTPQTRLLVVSHITSPTAMTLPVRQIARQAQAQGVAVCIDGPHAVAQIPLEIDQLNCDFYAASCHKWLCAPFGSGFLYVHPRRQNDVRPVVLSWGKLEPNKPARWDDEFQWLGTRDPSALLAVPAAIDFLQQAGVDSFRRRTHYLAGYARAEIQKLCDLPPIVPDDPSWYASMAHVPLPPGEALPLQVKLWKSYGIEVPVIDFAGRRWIRVSCHLYTQKEDIDRLVAALQQLLSDEAAS